MGRDAIKVAQLVEPQSQQQQHRQFQPFKGLLHQLAQVVVKTSLMPLHTKNKHGKQPAIRALQLVAGELLIDQVIGMQVAACQSLQDIKGSTAR